MTSQFPPAAVPGPDDEPDEEQQLHTQPDPFGEHTDEEGDPGTAPGSADEPDERPKDDPRGQ